MSLQDEQAKAEREASALRSILARYPDAKREDGNGVLIASVPMSAVTVVNVDPDKSGRLFVRFGDGEMSPPVWQADGYEVVSLLETLLDVPGGREALAVADKHVRQIETDDAAWARLAKAETGALMGAEEAREAARQALRDLGLDVDALMEEM